MTRSSVRCVESDKVPYGATDLISDQRDQMVLISGKSHLPV